MDAQAQRVAYQQSAGSAEQSKRCLLAAFARLGVPERMLDVGCGPGHLVRAAADLGAYAMGVDLNVDEEHFTGGKGTFCLSKLDLRHPHTFPEPFDLVLCLEVAEHLPASAADILCTTVASAVAPGGVLLFSAATPGQGGSGHVNERPHIYWLERLGLQDGKTTGLLWYPDASRAMARVWGTVAPDAWWYGKNLLMFRRQEAGDG